MADLLLFPHTGADLLSAADKALRRGDLATAIRYAQRAVDNDTCLTSSSMQKVRELIVEMQAIVDEQIAEVTG